MRRRAKAFTSCRLRAPSPSASASAKCKRTASARLFGWAAPGPPPAPSACASSAARCSSSRAGRSCSRAIWTSVSRSLPSMSTSRSRRMRSAKAGGEKGPVRRASSETSDVKSTSCAERVPSSLRSTLTKRSSNHCATNDSPTYCDPQFARVSSIATVNSLLLMTPSPSKSERFTSLTADLRPNSSVSDLASPTKAAILVCTREGKEYAATYSMHSNSRWLKPSPSMSQTASSRS
mmetsp:Transcript_35018/g.97757  ORF Transcript_35018/g.97757 Transcript_35018/m.97757 type:complete len:235 (+) Transcript_35018:142-846(+)